MRTGLALGVMMTLALAACDGGKSGADGGPAAASKASAQPAEEWVAAVPVSATTAPAQLRFLLAARPEPGKPFTLSLGVTAAQPVPDLQLDLESAAMTVDPASALVPVEEAGGTATHEFTVTAAGTGLAEISVRMRAGAEGAEARYAIPVLVEAPAEAGAAAASDKADPAAKGNDTDP